MIIDKIKGLKHPTLKESIKNGSWVLLVAVIAAAIISLFDKGILSIVSLFS